MIRNTFEFFKEILASRSIIDHQYYEQARDQSIASMEMNMRGTIYKMMEPPAVVTHRFSKLALLKMLFKNKPVIITIDRSLVLASPPRELSNSTFMVYSNARVHDPISDILLRRNK